jgi:dolichyl-phosphate beta-glucosyltransferase
VERESSSVVLVVPCYNEASRLDLRAFRAVGDRDAAVRFCFVNDGSRDGTLDLLRRLCSETSGRHLLVDLPGNRGKAEAVRQGLLAAVETGVPLVGFWDADLATPLEELGGFLDILETRPDVEIVLGSRVRLLGRSIHRSPVRHYLGRVFATGASLALGLPVYDTQCGAKVFRVTPTLQEVLREPFRTRWVFDVEVLARYLRARREEGASVAGRLYELPLARWTDVPGSKVSAWDFLRSGVELLRIWLAYRPRGTEGSVTRS